MMAGQKKLKDAVVLFAAVERSQQEALRKLAYERRVSLAELTRTAIAEFLAEAKAQRTKRKQEKAA